jgi:choline dehydrogenase
MKNGIDVYYQNENVGQQSACFLLRARSIADPQYSMQDHTYFSIIARSKESSSLQSVYNDISKLQAAQMEFSSNGGGPLNTPVGPSFAFESINATELASLGATSLLSDNRTNQAHVEYLIESIFFPNLPTPQGVSSMKNESYISLTAAVIAPVSRGNVTLRSNQIADAPVINPGVS